MDHESEVKLPKNYSNFANLQFDCYDYFLISINVIYCVIHIFFYLKLVFGYEDYKDESDNSEQRRDKKFKKGRKTHERKTPKILPKKNKNKEC